MVATLLHGLFLLGMAQPLAASSGSEAPAPHAPAVEHLASSESIAATDTTQVFLALAHRLEHSQARATIIRPAGADAPDMIMVTDATTPADLQQALQMLLQSRHSFGASVEREMRAHVPAASGAASDSEGAREAAAHLERLPTAPEVEVPGFGLVHSIFIQVVDLPTPGAAHVH